MHYVEVDQSGKIEYTKTATVLAFSDEISFAILIPAAVKRECLRSLRARGKSGSTLTLQLFATALFILFRDHIADIALATIDVEYHSRDREIKQHLLNLLRRAGHAVSSDRFVFQEIGKKSPAHRKAVETLRGKIEPDREIGLEELLEQL